MKDKLSGSFASLAGWFATAAAVAIVPTLLVSEKDRSPDFWYRVAWAEFLALVVWGYFSGFIWFLFHGGRKRAGIGGILPATGLVIGVYAVLSFVLMILSDWPNRFHWAGQVVLLVVVVLLFVFFEYARLSAVTGTEPTPEGLRSPAELCALIRLQENNLWSSATPLPLAGENRQLYDSLKTLREAIQYSLQNVGRIGGSQDYRAFVADTERLCTELQTAQAHSTDASHYRTNVEDLHRRMESISASLKVRPA